MNAGRIILLGIALIAGGGVFFLMTSGQDDAPTVSQIIPQADQVKVAEVLVADRDYFRGDRLVAEETRWVKWPVDSLPEGAVTRDNQAFYDSLNGTVARSTLVKNEPITETKVLRPGKSGMLAALLTPGKRAVTLDVSPRQAAGGFILPGDEIDLYYTANSGGGRNYNSELLYSNVRVLAIDQIWSQNDQSVIVGATVTLELAPPQIEGFLTARENGTVSLALRSAFQPENGDELIQETVPTDVVVIRYGQS